MRLLVFCGTRAAIERFDAADDWDILGVQFHADHRAETLARFIRNPNGKLAILGTFMSLGWRAPVDTAVLFDPSWRYNMDAAETIQAAARAATGWKG